jgi:hypothetical protein
MLTTPRTTNFVNDCLAGLTFPAQAILLSHIQSQRPASSPHPPLPIARPKDAIKRGLWMIVGNGTDC